MIAWLMGRLWPIAGVAFVALGLWGGAQSWRLGHAQKALVEIKQAWALDRAQATEVALKATNANRALEQELQTRTEKAAHDYAVLQSSHARAIVAARSDIDGLRKSVAAYAAGSGASASDSVAACGERAGKLGQLLAAALQSDAEHAANAESNADAVRALLEAWPK